MALTVRSAAWIPVSIPLRHPLQTARGPIERCQAVLLRLETSEGIVGLGEARTLVSRSEAEVFLHRHVVGRTFGSWRWFGIRNTPLATALETALADAMAQMAGKPLAALLADLWADAVPVNAVISGTAREAAERAGAAWKSGFRTIKIKVGQGSLREDQRRVESVRRNTGSMLLGLRIDANGAWDVKQAIRAIEALAHPDIEYVEQPVRSAGDLATLRRRCEVPIAADELVTGVAAAEELLALDAADILIVKPQMVGGLAAGREIISLAAERGKRAVVTTSIETGVGIAAALHLAATLIDPLACGLATAELLAHDLLVEPLEIEDGMMRLPDAPGLGVTLDEEAVERYRVGEA